MKKIVKRGMALASATVMIAGSVPMTSVNVLAAEDNGNQTAIQTQSDVTVQADSQVTSGKWGTCDWKYADGVLTVGGGVGENTGRTAYGHGDLNAGDNFVPWEALNGDIKKVVFTGKITFNEGAILNHMFLYFIALEEIEGLENLDVSNVTEMVGMFNCCYQLKSLDLSSWDMRNVKDMGGMFTSCKNIQSIKFGEKQSSNLQNMMGTFYSCTSLKTLDLSMLNTENLANVSRMFYNCEELTDLNIDNFYLPKAASLDYMFANCKKLKNINISNFNCNVLYDIEGMFLGCESLESIDVSWMDTSSVRVIDYMFSGCKSLKSLDLSSFRTGSVMYGIKNMIKDCTSLEKITMPQYRDGNNSMSNTVYDDLKDIASCLPDGPWTDITGEKVFTNKPYKYEPSHTYVKGNISQGDLRITTKVSADIGYYTDKTDTSKKIYTYRLNLDSDARGGAGDYYYSLSKYNAETNELESEDTAYTQSGSYSVNVTSLTGKHNFVINVKDSSGKIVSSSPFLYDGGSEDDSESKWGTCSWSLKDGVLTINGGVAGYIDSSPWYKDSSIRSTIKEVNITGNVIMGKSLNNMFSGFTNLETINGLENLVTDKVTSMRYMFNYCRKLKTINALGSLNTESVTNMEYMFSSCESLENLDGIEKWNTSNVKTMVSMFDGCKSLPSDSVIGKLDMSNTTKIFRMFLNCYKFENIDCSKMNISNAESLSEMFMNCKNLKTVSNVDKIITSKITSIGGMFYGCSNLTEIQGLKNADTSNVKYFGDMFRGCAKLTNVNDAEYFDTSNATNMSNMFKGCSLLKEFNMNGYDTSKLTNTSYMFANCENLINVKMDAIDAFEANDMSNMFYGCDSLQTVDLQKFKITSKSKCADAFKYCDLKKVIMPSQMEDNESFDEAMASALKNGEWKDTTSGKTYTSVPDELTAGHTYEYQKSSGGLYITEQLEKCIDSHIYLSGKASGGDGNYTYKFIMYNKKTKQWTKLKDYSSSRYCYIVPSGYGDKEFYVEVKDGAGRVVRSKAITMNTSGEVSQELSITARKKETDKTVTFTADAAGGSSGYTYKFIVYNKTTGTWGVVQNFSDKNTCTWTKGSVGDRDFYVDVKDSDGNVVRSKALNVKIENNKPTAELTPSSTVVSAGDKLTLTASTNKSGCTYKFLIYNPSTDQWFKLQDFTSSSTYTWTAGSDGTRQFYVDVKDSDGNVTRSKVVNVTIGGEGALSVKAAVSANTTKVGDKITFTAEGAGGKEGYTYKVVVYNKTTKTWGLVQNFSSNNKITWTAGSAGDRDFYIDVKDASGKVVRSSVMNVKTSN